MEYYSAIKKKGEAMQFAATWIELESIMLSTVSHRERNRLRMISLNRWGLKKLRRGISNAQGQIETKSRRSDHRFESCNWGRRGWEIG